MESYIRHLFILFSFFCVITSCAPRQPEPPPKTQLEIREFQTRTFSTENVRLVMKSMLNVLQDEGYIVKNVALDLGFLTAAKEEDIEHSSDRFWMGLAAGKDARWIKHKIIEATCNVTEFGNQTRVRVNFQQKIMDNHAAIVTIKQITDEHFYQDFFSKVDKGIFIQEQNI
jgi:hypothetical protein